MLEQKFVQKIPVKNQFSTEHLLNAGERTLEIFVHIR